MATVAATNSSAKNSGMDVFPDLHHKMSKKIAQLTKVIYHLNTKNEDHALEIEQVNASHQLEIQQILRDAAGRISKFKDAVEQRQQSANQEKQLEKLQKKYEAEKMNAQQEIAALKGKMSEREAKIAAEFTAKYEALKREIENVNTKFSEKITVFEQVNSDLKSSLSSTSQQTAEGLTELKKKYETEIADLVRSSNEKYNAMLVEQLGKFEALNREKEAQSAADRQKAALDLDRELGQLRAKLHAEKQEALRAQSKLNEENLAKSKESFLLSLQQQQQKESRDQLQQHQTAFDQQLLQRQEQIDQLQRRISLLQGSSQDQAKGYLQQLEELRVLTKTQQQDLLVRDQSLAQQRVVLAEQEAAASRLAEELAKLQQLLRQETQQRETLVKEQATQRRQADEALAAAEREKAAFVKEVNTLGSSLQREKEEAKRLRDEAAQAATDSQTKLIAMTKEQQRLQRELAELQAGLRASQGSSAQEVQRLQQELSASRSDHDQRLANLQREHQTAAMQLEQTLQQRQQTAEQAWQRERNELQQERDRWQGEVDLMKKQHEERLARELQRFEQRLGESERAREELLQTKDEAIKGLEEQLAADRQALANQQQTSRQEYAKLEMKYKSLQKEIESRRQEYEKGEVVTSSLKAQIDALREELKATQQAYRSQMDSSLGKLEDQWRRRLEEETQRLTSQQTADQQQLLGQHRDELAKLQAMYAEDLAALKSLLQKEEREYRSQLAAVEQKREQLEATLQIDRRQHRDEVMTLQTTHSAAIKALEENAAQELDRLRRELRSQAEGQLSSQRDGLQAEIQRLEALLLTRAAEAEQRRQTDLEQMTRQTAEQVESTRQTAEQRGREEKEAALAALRQQQAADSEKLQQEHLLALDQLQQVIQQEREKVTSLTQQLSGLQGNLAALRQEQHRREEVFVLERDGLLRDGQMSLRKEKEASERALLETMDRHEVDLQIAMREVQEMKARYEERLVQMAREYKALEERYLQRESRSEDLIRIASLEREVVDKEEQLVRTREEMLYFKREMLNREENYNGKFNRAPTVGVMQVLKPKDGGGIAETNNPGNNAFGAKGGGGGGGFGGSKPSAMRVINTQTGASAMMAGGGLGLGMGIGSNGTTSAAIPGMSTKSSRSVK